ncbi:HTH-type transcriptional regulator ImmR [Lachnospiraceae bacterium]|nr:HTH-type transcriptional regulator ImmR [Lachnospiraceae bacterium]
MDIMENIETEVMNMNISERLQELRKKEGYSQEQVAEMLGLSRQAISKWESGQGKPEIDNIIKLTEIYHVSADYILLGTEKISVPAPEKKELSHEYKKAIGIIAIIAATAIITVLFITALGLLSRLGI